MNKLVVGRKNDRKDGKLRWELLQLDCVEDIVKILTFGANKYADNSWQLLENAKDRYYAAAMRHLTAYRNGESIDSDSGMPHLSHLACNVHFLQWLEKHKKDVKKKTTKVD